MDDDTICSMNEHCYNFSLTSDEKLSLITENSLYSTAISDAVDLSLLTPSENFIMENNKMYTVHNVDDEVNKITILREGILQSETSPLIKDSHYLGLILALEQMDLDRKIPNPFLGLQEYSEISELQSELYTTYFSEVTDYCYNPSNNQGQLDPKHRFVFLEIVERPLLKYIKEPFFNENLEIWIICISNLRTDKRSPELRKWIGEKRQPLRLYCTISTEENFCDVCDWKPNQYIDLEIDLANLRAQTTRRMKKLLSGLILSQIFKFIIINIIQRIVFLIIINSSVLL